IGLCCWKSRNRLANHGLTSLLVRLNWLIWEERVLLTGNGHWIVRLRLLSSGIGNGSKRRLYHRLRLYLWLRLLLKRLRLLLKRLRLPLNGWKFLNKRLIERLDRRRRVVRLRRSRISSRRTQRSCLYDDALTLNHYIVERLTLKHLSKTIRELQVGKLYAEAPVRQLRGNFRLHSCSKVDQL